jgi:hypothetical protein
MTKWNKRYASDKQAGIDFSVLPGMIEHGIKDVAHGFNTFRNQWDQLFNKKNPEGQQDAMAQLMGETGAAAYGINKLKDKYLDVAGRPTDRARDNLLNHLAIHHDLHGDKLDAYLADEGIDPKMKKNYRELEKFHHIDHAHGDLGQWDHTHGEQ